MKLLTYFEHNSKLKDILNSVNLNDTNIKALKEINYTTIAIFSQQNID